MKRIAGTLLGVLSTVLLVGATGPSHVPHEYGLIKGLDGGLYQPYKPSVIRETQQALKEKGLYDGPVNGRFDEATMHAVGKFQKEHDILVSGVPSPYTRAALFPSEKG